MTAYLLPQGKQQYFTNAGIPLVGGKLFTYDTGTTTPRTTWSDAAQTAPNANPIILDARGEATVFWSGAYRVALQDSLGNAIYTIDGVAIDSDQLRADLANTVSSVLGAGLVGYSPTLAYAASTVGGFLYSIYKRTAAEIAAGITPSNYNFESHDVCGFVLPERYGAVGNGNAGDATNGALDTIAIGRAVTIAAATKCPILLSRAYIAVPATASTQADPAPITVAWLIQTNLNVLGIGGASITLANNQSTDAVPKCLALFHTDSVRSNISFKNVIFDLNGANNLISPLRPVTYERRFNMAAISVSGTPAGVAARVNDVLIEGCTFKNCPGVCQVVCGQTNTPGTLLGERWTIKNNLFLNNGTDTSDHTSVFAWCNTVTCDGNIFWEDQPPHTVGKTGGATCYEVHGSNHRVTGNYFFNYTLGLYVGSNFTSSVLGTVIANNDFYCSDYGIILYRQQVPASAAVDGVLIEGNSFYFDNYTYAGQPVSRSCVTFQGQIATQQLAINNVKITGNYAIAAGTSLFSNFVRWDTVVTLGGNVCSNLCITDNEVIGFTQGVYILTNGANGMGYTEISGNEFVALTPDSLANPPRGISINANGGFTTLVIDRNQFIDERGGGASFNTGIFFSAAGTISDLYLGTQTFKGLTAANFNNSGAIITRQIGPAFEQGANNVADGGTIAFNANHAGLTPRSITCTGTIAGEFVSVTAIGATTFTVAIKKWTGGVLTAGTNQTVYWRVQF